MTFPFSVDAISKAAVSPLALVAYLAALGSWTFIAARVRRNKNLLVNLEKLPEKDRFAALQAELGGIPLPNDMPVNAWLKARIHRYYFWAVVLLCALAVIIFAIATFAKKPDLTYLNKAVSDIDNATNKIETNTDKMASNTDPEYVDRQALGDIKLGDQRAYVVSRLGVPQHEEDEWKTVKCLDYEKPSYKAYLVFDRSTESLQFYRISPKEKTFHPNISSFEENWPFDSTTCVGCKHFADLADMSPTYFNYSAKLWEYVESYHYETPTYNMIIFALYTGFAVDYDPPEESSPIWVTQDFAKSKGLNLTAVLYKATGTPSSENPDWDNDGAPKLTADERAVFDKYRQLTSFNEYAWLNGKFEITDEGDAEAFELERGGHSSCPDNNDAWD